MRGALMLTMDIRHPDIMQFIKIKRDLSKVTGANISIKIREDFMKAVEGGDTDYILRYPIDIDKDYPIINDLEIHADAKYNKLYPIIDNGKVKGYTKKIKAKEYWEEIVKSARDFAEPGLLFWDNMLKNGPDGVYDEFKPVSTNPCFSYNTKILTAEGYKKIGSLENQELDFINYKGEVVQGKVFESGSKPIYKMKLSNNEVIETTIHHEFMLTDGSRKEAQFIKDERIMPFYKINNEVNIFTNYGFIQGDGSLGRLDSDSHLGMEIYIGENDEDICELFGVKNTGKHYLRGYNEILKELKFDSSSLPTRTLPLTFWNWSDKNKLMFLKGLWSANGSIIKGHRIAFKSTSKELIEELVKILNYFDIKSYYTTNKAKEVKFKNGTYECKESYDLNISRYNSVLKFAELISFVHSYKRNSLEDLIKAKAPKVVKATIENVQKVYDFSLQDNTHWGVIQGVIAHNCAEIGMGAYDACRLIAVNLFGFVDNPFTDKASFNFERFYRINYEAMRLSDDVIDLEIQSIRRIIHKIESDKEPDSVKSTELGLWEKIKSVAAATRRTGLGFTGLGDTLAALGYAYDSNEAMEIVDKIMRTKMESELDCTIDLAELRGKFPAQELEKEFPSGNPYYEFLEKEFPERAKRMAEVGRRNLSFSTVAPTGSVSILAQVTSGLEPLFQPFYIRRKKVNPGENVRVDFVDDSGDSWQEFAILHPKFKDWIILFTDRKKDDQLLDLNKTDLEVLFKKSPWYESTANDIDWIKRVELQSIIQKYISHSISSTINLPEDVSYEEVGDIYFESWKKNLKGVTIYRDNCRSGVLVSDKKDKKKSVRPEKVECDIYHNTSKGDKFTTLIGLVNEKPYEIFCLPGHIATNYEKGVLIKLGGGRYKLDCTPNENYGVFPEITDGMPEELKALSIGLSYCLRYGAPVDKLVRKMGQIDTSIVSFPKVMARNLSKYMNGEVKKGFKCPSCEQNDSVIFEEGCKTCKNCGWSAC